MKQFLKQIAMSSIALGLVSAGLLCAKAPISTVTISSGGLPKPIELTDPEAIKSINIWSGPGNFKMENGVRTPIVRDGSILWTRGIVSDPPQGPAEHEISFNDSSPEARLYVVLYRYDPAARSVTCICPEKARSGTT